MLASILRAIAIAAAGVWLGGMVLFAIVAQTNFQTMRATGVEHPDAIAGQVMAKNFARFDGVQMACASVLFGSLLIRLAAGRRRWMDWFRFCLAFAAACILAYSGAVLTPKIAGLQSAVAGADPDAAVRAIFDDFHVTAVRLSKINLGLVAILLGTLGFVPPSKRPIGADTYANPRTLDKIGRG